MKRRHDIAISGGGLAGLALALALRRALGSDLDLVVLDRVAPTSAAAAGDARAYAVSASSRNLLEAIGVWSRVASAAAPVTEILITDTPLDAAMRPVALTYANFVGTDPASYIVPNAALLEAMRAAVADVGIRIVAPATATGLDVGAGHATIALSDGGSIHASLVVAAEGRRSTLREAAGIKVIGWSYDQRAIVATIGHELAHEGRAIQHFLPSGPFAILPLPGRQSSITWSERREEAARILARDDAGFLAEVEQRFAGRLGRLTLAGPRQSWPLEMHLARAYVGRRLALLGDTAHGVHPIAGQGLNLALRDVAALAESLADAMRLGLDAGDAGALARYERWRRTDSAVSAAAYDAINRLFSNDWGLLRAVREAGLGVVDRLDGLKRLLVSEAAGLTGEAPKLLRGEAI